jgi:riboflavin synthase
VEAITPSHTVKTRMITVRMSNEEYDAICAVTMDLGLRNVSELARTAMRALVRTSHHLAEKPAELKLADRIEEHDMLLQSLVQEIRRLKRVAGEHARAETRNKAFLSAIMQRNRLR